MSLNSQLLRGNSLGKNGYSVLPGFHQSVRDAEAAKYMQPLELPHHITTRRWKHQDKYQGSRSSKTISGGREDYTRTI